MVSADCLDPGAQKSPQRPDKVGTVDRVLLQCLPFAGRGFTGFVEKCRRNEDFANVMEEGTPAHLFDFDVRKTHLDGDQFSHCSGAVRMAPRPAVVSVEGGSEDYDLFCQRRWAVVMLRVAGPLLQFLHAGAAESDREPRRGPIGKDQAQSQQHGEREEAPTEAFQGHKS